MNIFTKTGALGLVLIMSAACSTSGETSTKVKALQKSDKQLTCKEILLEMNEAEFHKGMADKNKGPKLKYVFMPLGYISTYMDAEEAIEASNARVSYLNKIYEISGCDGTMAQRAVPVNYPAGQSQYYRQQPAPQVHYQMQPHVMAPMQPQTAGLPVYDMSSSASVNSFPGRYSAY